MRSFDPDQDSDVINEGDSSSFVTNNDVENPSSNSSVAISRAAGVFSDLSVNLVSLDGSAKGSNFGFTNRNPFDPKAFDSPVDEGGAPNDIAITLTMNFGTMAAGETITKSFVTAFQSNTLDSASNNSNDFITLTGTGANTWNSGNGNDTVISYGSNDDINLGAGDDTVIAVNVSTQSASNEYTGGTGTDTLDYSNVAGQIDIVTKNSTQYTITELSGPNRQDEATTIERFIGTKSNDVFRGSSTNDDFAGHTGQDSITTGSGTDIFRYHNKTDGEVVSANRSDHSAHAGDIWVDFDSGSDSIALSDKFNLGNAIVTGTNFEVLGVAFDGTNAVSSRFGAGAETLIHDTVNDILFFDDNGSAAGFTVLATLSNSETILSSDFTLFTTG
jgi:Ca2+-binding RTX toxin-like protein